MIKKIWMMKNLTLRAMMKTRLAGIGVLSFLLMLFSVKVTAQANFSLFPASTTVDIGQTFTIEVRVDLNQGTNTEVDVAEAYVNFNPSYLQVLSVSNGGTLTTVAANNFNNSNGRFDYAAGTLSSPVTADFTLVTITFQAMGAPPGGTTDVTFNTALPRRTDAFRAGNSVLGTLTNATVTIIANNLPVTFIDFRAASQDKNVILNWTTATESNNKGFEIERSRDGNNWTNIGFVNGAGNSSEQKKYSYNDNQLAPGVYHYRLKQVDNNGTFEYSRIVTIRLHENKVFELGQNRPNPFRGTTFVSFSLAEKRRVTLTLFDTRGRLIKTLLDETREAGSHVVDLNLQTLPAGVYYYKMVAGDFADVKKMIVR